MPFAPPFLRDGDLVVSHVANILHYLGPKIGLAPAGEASRVFAHGLQLTITDLVSEVHDTHHPIAANLYYEDQKEEAKARALAFLSERAPNISAISSACWPTIRREKRMLSGTGSPPSTCRCSRSGSASPTPFRAHLPARTSFIPLSPPSRPRSRRNRTSPPTSRRSAAFPFNETGVFRCYSGAR